MTPPVELSRVGRHTAVYAVGILVGRAVSFVMLPFYTHYLTPADYGVMQLVDMTLDVVGIFAGSQIASGIFRYYHKAEDEAGKTEVLSTALILLATSFGAFAVGAGLAAPRISRLVFGSAEQVVLIRIAAASLGIQTFVTAPLALLRLEERSLQFTYVNFAKLSLQVVLNVVLLAGFRLGVKGIFIGTLVANTVLSVGLGAPFVVRVGLRFSKRWAYSLLRYGVPLIGTQMATFIATFGDRYFLRVHGDVATVGLYSLAYQFGFILATVGYLPFSMMWEPMRFQVAKHSSRDEMYARAFVHMNLLLLTAALGIGLFVDDFIRVMTQPAYHSAAQLVPIILVAYVIQGWAQFHEVGVLVRERTEFITLANWLAAATALVGYAVLIPRWLGLGAAVATVLAFAVRLCATYLASQRLLPIRYRWQPLARLVGAALFVYVASLLLPVLPLWESLLLRCVLFGTYLLLVWFGGVMLPDEQQRVRDWITWRRVPAGAARRLLDRSNRSGNEAAYGGGKAAMALEIERCRDLAAAEEIQQLFLRNDRPDFPEMFDLVYPRALADGGSSWVARSPDGRVVGHVAVFPREFRDASRVLRAALFGDLMMDPEHRDFWSAVQLFRRATADLRAEGKFDFAYAHTTAQAQGILRAAGLREIGALRRFTTLVHPFYRVFFRLKTRARPLLVERLNSPWEARIVAALSTVPPGPYFRGDRSVGLYGPHLGRKSLRDWEWLLFRRRKEGQESPVAFALAARVAGAGTLAVSDLQWDEGRVSAASVLDALSRAAWAAGYTKLSISAFGPSRLAETLARCGFLLREDVLPLLVLPIGDSVLPPTRDWLLTFLDGSAW